MAWEKQLADWHWVNEPEFSAFIRAFLPVYEYLHMNIIGRNQRYIFDNSTPSGLMQMDTCLPSYLLAAHLFFLSSGNNPDIIRLSYTMEEDYFEGLSLLNRTLYTIEAECGKEQYRDFLFSTIRLSTEHIRYNIMQIKSMRDTLDTNILNTDAYLSQGIHKLHTHPKLLGRFEVADFGVHRGADSLYYITEGYRVVGIEPDPRSVDWLEDRFDAPFTNGAFNLFTAFIANRSQSWRNLKSKSKFRLKIHKRQNRSKNVKIDSKIVKTVVQIVILIKFIHFFQKSTRQR